MNFSKKVLFVGQAYYNHWYLSRALRKLGWKADLVQLPGAAGDEHLYRGYDQLINNSSHENKLQSFRFYFWSIFEYDVFHFANTHGIRFIDHFDGLSSKSAGAFKKISFSINKRIFKAFVKNKPSRLFFIKKIIGIGGIYKLLRYYENLLPERWDILLLKYFGKKIVYTNNGCQDGVTPSSFAKWSTPNNEPICTICPWQKNPQICSDALISHWGSFRNHVADYQCLLGGNRADYNISEKVHEVPQVYCLDPDFWNPEILIPSNYILPISKDIVKIYHAVGNFSTRAHQGIKTIKSTHLYVPLIDELKNEGHKVELVFFADVPNKAMRYYQLQSDIIVDMLTYGFFGANVREGMMLGKPCVCYLRPEWLEQMRAEIPDYVDELPVICATPDTIKSLLIDLINNPQKRKEIGDKSRAFALKWHSDDAAANRMSEIYKSLFTKVNE